MDAVGIFLQSTAKHISPSDSVIRQLCVRARQGSTEARDRLVRAHLGLVVHIAKYFYRPGAFCDLGDLIQQGCLGLMRAIEKYDPRTISHGKAVRFATYAHFWVSHSIRREIENNGRTVAVPIDRIKSYMKNKRKNLAPKRGNAIQDAVNSAMQPMVALDGDHWVEEDGQLMQLLLVDFKDTPEEWCKPWEIGYQVERYLALLPPMVQNVLRERFGLAGSSGPLTQQEVADKLGVSDSLVGNWERSALKTLSSAANP